MEFLRRTLIAVIALILTIIPSVVFADECLPKADVSEAEASEENDAAIAADTASEEIEETEEAEEVTAQPEPVEPEIAEETEVIPEVTEIDNGSEAQENCTPEKPEKRPSPYEVAADRIRAGGDYADLFDLRIPDSEDDALLDYLIKAGLVVGDVSFLSVDGYIYCFMQDAEEDDEEEQAEMPAKSVKKEEPPVRNEQVAAPCEEISPGITEHAPEAEPVSDYPEPSEEGSGEPVAGFFGSLLLFFCTAKHIITTIL